MLFWWGFAVSDVGLFGFSVSESRRQSGWGFEEFLDGDCGSGMEKSEVGRVIDDRISASGGISLLFCIAII